MPLDIDSQRLLALLHRYPQRARLIKLVSRLNLPDGWVAAGLIRNLVWDHLHNQPLSPLNDIDVIYFDADDTQGVRALAAETWLHQQAPDHNWQVRNQALMHARHGHAPYRDCGEAMGFWPECETAVAVRWLATTAQWQVLAPFGLHSLLAGRLTANPLRPAELFQQRLQHKGWLQRWPRLRLASPTEPTPSHPGIRHPWSPADGRE